MALTHALSTNNYGEAHLIVATSAANGTHTTLAGAMADAVSGDTIFLRDSVTENVTLTAGVNIAAWTGGTLNTPTITGTLTMTTAGTCNISGIRLVTNSAALLAVTGSAASVVNLRNCYLNMTNNTGITFSSSSGSALIAIYNCLGDLGTTGIAAFSHSSSGILQIFSTQITNTGGSSTASTCSAGILIISKSGFTNPITSSGTGGIILEYTSFDTTAQNATALTCGGSGNNAARWCQFVAGSASAVSIGSTLATIDCNISSSNTNSVTGAGNLIYSPLDFQGSSSTVNTSTQTPLQIGPKIYTNGGISFDAGTNLLANYATGTWTPTIIGQSVAGTTTYTAQFGYYTRIGNIVMVQATVTASAATGTGAVVLGGLPFTIKSQTGGGAYGAMLSSSGVGLTWPAGTTMLVAQGIANSTFSLVFASGSASGGGSLQMANTGLNFQYTMMYQI